MIRTLSLIAAGLLLTGRMAGAQQPTPTPTPAAAPAAAKPDSTKADSAKKLTADQLQSLVAPIALYPDDLLTNVWSRPPTRSRSSRSTSTWPSIPS